MNSEKAFRVALVVIGAAYMLPRFYCRWRPSQSAAPRGTELGNVSEGRLRLMLMGITGFGADLLVVAWAFNPLLLARSSLPLPPWPRWLGLPLGLVAVSLAYAAHRTLGASFTATLKMLYDHRFVGEGVYRWMRHPMYTSFFALFATSALITANWLVAGLGMFHSLLIVQRVSEEEAMLLESFGEHYCLYIRHTGRFLPRLLR